MKLYITDYTIYIGHHLRLSIIRMKCPSFWFQLSQFSSRWFEWMFHSVLLMFPFNQFGPVFGQGISAWPTFLRNLNTTKRIGSLTVCTSSFYICLFFCLLICFTRQYRDQGVFPSGFKQSVMSYPVNSSGGTIFLTSETGNLVITSPQRHSHKYVNEILVYFLRNDIVQYIINKVERPSSPDFLRTDTGQVVQL